MAGTGLTMERGWRSGPRLDYRPPSGEHVDPDNGCFNGCGESRAAMLRTYQLVYDGKRTGFVWRLCADCVNWGQVELNPDPLTLGQD